MTTSAPVDIGQLIVCRPGVYGGRPCLVGTRIPVHTIAVLHEEEGMSSEKILDEFPHLDLARIYAALAYYYANKAQIDADLEAEGKLYDELAAKYPHGWTPETDRP